MEFLKNNRRFSFLYGNKPIEECDYTVTVEEKENELVTVYSFADGFKVTNIAKKTDKFGSYEWVNYFENTADKATEIISELWDADFKLPLGHEEKHKASAFIPDPEEITKVYNPNGSSCSGYEFYTDVDEQSECRALHYFKSGNTREYGEEGGRSSENKHSPFFNVHKAGEGFICAIGWTGKWKARVERLDDEVSFKSSVECVHLRLRPG